MRVIIVSIMIMTMMAWHALWVRVPLTITICKATRLPKKDQCINCMCTPSTMQSGFGNAMFLRNLMLLLTIYTYHHLAYPSTLYWVDISCGIKWMKIRKCLKCYITWYTRQISRGLTRNMLLWQDHPWTWSVRIKYKKTEQQKLHKTYKSKISKKCLVKTRKGWTS